MLHQISWFTYTVSTLMLCSMYYVYVGITFYRSELQSFINRISGRQPVIKIAGKGDFEIPDYSVTGIAQPSEISFIAQDELSFGPPESTDDLAQLQSPTPPGSDSRLISDFSEMVSEVKTLIRVINEYSESKENFEMLFRLIIQKYHSLSGTAYQKQINELMLNEGAPEFHFSLTETDLNEYWNN
jgi:hypothetical protein